MNSKHVSSSNMRAKPSTSVTQILGVYQRGMGVTMAGAAPMNGDLQKVKAKFGDLIRSPLHSFPASRRRLKETDKRGVYVIYSPHGKVLHVGGTPRGKHGIRQRLGDHLHGQSSFTIKSKYLWQHGGRTLKERYTYVRKHCSYRCMAIEDHRLRVLLEAYAIGHLCPDHVGLHQVVS
jgi:hypothetical protein